jgi:hypothetical protein
MWVTICSFMLKTDKYPHFMLDVILVFCYTAVSHLSQSFDISDPFSSKRTTRTQMDAHTGNVSELAPRNI